MKWSPQVLAAKALVRAADDVRAAYAHDPSLVSPALVAVLAQTAATATAVAAHVSRGKHLARYGQYNRKRSVAGAVRRMERAVEAVIPTTLDRGFSRAPAALCHGGDS